MERVNDEGERREATPAEVAQYDQVEAHFHTLTQQLLSLKGSIQEAANAGDNERMGRLTKKMDSIARREWIDQHPSQAVNFIMYLINQLEKSIDWTDDVFDATGAALRLLAAMQRPGHPVNNLPGFDMASLRRDIDAVLVALSTPEDGETFVTDSGVTLENVHAHDRCEGPFCVVHRPAPGPWDNWQTHWREDWRLMVRICPHKVQHVAVEEQMRMPLLGMFDHEHPDGCDCNCSLEACDPVTDEEGNIIGFIGK